MHLRCRHAPLLPACTCAHDTRGSFCAPSPSIHNIQLHPLNTGVQKSRLKRYVCDSLRTLSALHQHQTPEKLTCGGAPATKARVCNRRSLHPLRVARSLKLPAGRGIDLSAVERTEHPTRDVLVERSLEGDRTFAGFGKAAADQYSDCFIDPAKLPERTLRVRPDPGGSGLAEPGRGPFTSRRQQLYNFVWLQCNVRQTTTGA